MRLKKYEQPNVEIEFFYQEVLTGSMPFTGQDKWDDLEDNLF